MLSVPSDFILEGEIGIADDLIVLPLQASTQWDALAHISHRGTQYGGRDSGLTTTRGARVNGIEAVAGRIATRGVLCDLPRHLGVACLEPGYAITAEELVSALAATGVAVGEGDILLVRTGHMARCRPNHWRGYANSDTPGLGIDTLEWIHECRLAGVCTDTSAVEVRPSQIEGIPLPFHVVALVYMGLLLGEIFDLEELAVRCAADGRYDFFVVAPPLLVSGAVGAPINPYAIK
jgi:kynurenine formamidase